MHENDGTTKPIYLASEEGDAFSDDEGQVGEGTPAISSTETLPAQKLETPSSDNEDRIVLNVGGVRHETHLATLRKIENTRLSCLAERHEFSGIQKDVYFFDRHPAVFNSVIDFYRTVNGGWTSWTGWTACGVTCSSSAVYQTRLRSCTNPVPQYNGATCSGSSDDSKACSLSHCPIDGNWATWASWSTCTVTCAGGSQQRSRTCTNPAPQHNGADCSGVDSQTQDCNTHNCPIDGGWTVWTSWTACGVTCSSVPVYQTRLRSCTNPVPQYNGANCPGSSDDSIDCQLTHCPIDGNWATWSSWSTCTVTCAGGSQQRSRTCTNPSPQYNGADCPGVDSQTQDCNTHNCPIDGGWADWTSWAACSVTCSSVPVYQTRTRTCTNPAPQYNGADCPGSADDSTACNLSPCPVDGQWGSWNRYSACSASCLGGWRNRTRDCNNPAPAHGGAACVGSEWETDFCNDISCNIAPPVDGNWGVWQSWQGCSVTCGTGVQRRYRNCDDPPPDHNGLPCYGDSYEENSCSGGGSCPVAVDGNWGAWSQTSSCSATCGQGRAMKVRNCDNPAPSNGGKICTGDSMIFITCIDRTCTSGNGTGSGTGHGAGYVNACPNGYFTCNSGKITCIQEAFICDCVSDCTDDSDEDEGWAGCDPLSVAQCGGAKGTHRIELLMLGVLLMVSVVLGHI